MKTKLWIFILVAPLMGITLVSTQIYYGLKMWTYSGPDKVFEIKSGDGFANINYRLNKEGLIYSPKLFHRYAQFRDVMGKFKTGNFIIVKGSNLIEVTNTLINGISITTKVTIPEGKNLFQIGKILESKGICSFKDFVTEAKNIDLVTSLDIPADRAEGYLYPDTYFFSPKSEAEIIIRTMVNNFKNKTKSVDFNKSELSKHEVITLASVVEKETGAYFERPTIAGVFINRLNKKMRLQSDPTTIYGIYETFNGNLRKRHLQEKTPYNTYRISGLPKGPIANPGMASIKAVLTPKKHKFLYFVSQNDGTHVFSKTYREHNQAVSKYQKNRKNRKGKSWRNLQQK